MSIPITLLDFFYFSSRLTLLFNSFGLMCRVLRNSHSPNHPDLEQRTPSRFLEAVITFMLRSLSQTGIKRKYNMLGKLSHICLTGSFFLLPLSRSIHPGHCWKGGCFPLAPQPWRRSRLLTRSRRQEDGGSRNSALQLCHSRIKWIKKKAKEEAQEVTDSFLCRHGPLWPARRTRGVHEEFRALLPLLTGPQVAGEQARDPPSWGTAE